jgi:pyruvate kinase
MRTDRLTYELQQILELIESLEPQLSEAVKDVHPNHRLSAKNLLRYLTLRTFDLRKYHDHLSDHGLSSLRTSEGYVYSNLKTVVNNLHLIRGLSYKQDHRDLKIEQIGFKKSKITQKVFGT